MDVYRAADDQPADGLRSRIDGARRATLPADLQHDIRAAASTIVWLASVLEAQPPDERDRTRAVMGIVECAQMINGLVADDVPTRRTQVVGLGALVRSSVERARLTFPITIAIDDAAPDAVITARSLDVSRVLDNLLANACEAAGRDGSVTIGIAGDVDDVELEIVDSGPGFDPNRVAAGLGLGIVTALVQRLNGTFTVTRLDERGGTRVVLRLPRAMESDAVVEQSRNVFR
jgi:signal transduction histidine kinase